MKYKGRIISYITPEGKIEHEYKGTGNGVPLTGCDPIAELITAQHKETMKRFGLKRLETRLDKD